MGRDDMPIHRFPLDRSTADRLAGGALHPSDAPPGYERVAEVLFEAGQPPVVDLGAEIDERLLGDLVLAIAHPDTRTRPMLRELLTAKVAAIAAATVLSATGVAAAATGSLPGPAQDAVSDVAGAVGLEVPTSDDDDLGEPVEVDDPSDSTDAGTDGTDGTDDTDGTGDGTDGTEDGDGEGTGGATAAHAGNPTDADDHGAAVSETARGTDATGRDHGAAVSEVARSGHGGNGDGNGGGGTSTTSTTIDDTTSTTVDDSDDETDADASGRGPGGSGSNGGSNRGRG